MMNAYKALRSALVVALVTCGATLAAAQDFPLRRITVVVPYPAGGTTDVNTRVVVENVSLIIGQPLIVDNRPGGGAQIAATYVKRAAPDGYTLMIADLHTHAINAALHPDLPYDPVKDYEPITLMWNYPSVVTVPQRSPAKTMSDLVELARSSPNGLTFASQGEGTTGHLLPEKLRLEKKINLVHVPYKGAAPALNDLVSGQVDLFFAGVNATIVAMARTGRVRLLAVTDSQRAELLPEVPTMAEAGFPGYESRLWAGVVAPAGTPLPVITKLNAVFVSALKDPDVVRRLVSSGTKISTSSPGEFAALIKADIKVMSELVEQSGTPRN